jgi:hypothetical protein
LLLGSRLLSVCPKDTRHIVHTHTHTHTHTEEEDEEVVEEVEVEERERPMGKTTPGGVQEGLFVSTMI